MWTRSKVCVDLVQIGAGPGPVGIPIGVCTPGAQPEAGFVYIHHTKRRQSIKRQQNEIASTKQKVSKANTDVRDEDIWKEVR